MKLASASSAFSRPIERGDLTQLEFIEFCAHELAVDGIVLDVRHFPRIDDDYLAQIKKMAVDLGLTIAALQDDLFFAAEEPAMQATLRIALETGAPLIAAPLASETLMPWNEQRTRLGTAASFAKAANVTLALRNAPGTFAATIHDLKRATKETDSAWLRLGPEPALFAVSEDPTAIVKKVVLLWADDTTGSAAVRNFANYRGFVVIRPHEASAAES